KRPLGRNTRQPHAPCLGGRLAGQAGGPFTDAGDAAFGDRMGGGRFFGRGSNRNGKRPQATRRFLCVLLGWWKLAAAESAERPRLPGPPRGSRSKGGRHYSPSRGDDRFAGPG